MCQIKNLLNLIISFPIFHLYTYFIYIKTRKSLEYVNTVWTQRFLFWFSVCLFNPLKWGMMTRKMLFMRDKWLMIKRLEFNFISLRFIFGVSICVFTNWVACIQQIGFQQFRCVNLIGWMILVEKWLNVEMFRCSCLASIVKYRFRQYFYYPRSTLIMFGTAALEPTNSDGAMNSSAMLIDFCCTIRLQRTFLIPFERAEKKFRMIKKYFHYIFLTKMLLTNWTNGSHMVEFSRNWLDG